MSGLLLPSAVPASTRQIVIRSLMAVPKVNRFLDTPGLLVAVAFMPRHLAPSFAATICIQRLNSRIDNWQPNSAYPACVCSGSSPQTPILRKT